MMSDRKAAFLPADRPVIAALGPELPGSVLTLEQCAEWARAYGTWLPEGSVIALHGELGAGKTTLVRALCEGLGVHDTDAVTSPTFALMHEYDTARGVVVHADLYRLRSPDDLDQLGWDELTSLAAATLVEWPERAAGRLPAATHHIFLEHVANRSDVRGIRVVR